MYVEDEAEEDQSQCGVEAKGRPVEAGYRKFLRSTRSGKHRFCKPSFRL